MTELVLPAIDRSAIPTIYRGVRFRSRLEATWAAWFDLVGWTWDYEPFDCNGWIPDFALKSEYNSPSPLLVEVKPIYSFDKSVADKLDRADQEHEIVLVGLGPSITQYSSSMSTDTEGFPGPQLGWLRETGYENIAGWWQQALLGNWDWETIGFCPAYGHFGDRISGIYHGGHIYTDNVGDQCMTYWAAAKNLVQWRRDA